MQVASVIVEVEDGVAGAVLSGLAAVSGATVFGVKENKIVVVIEGPSLGEIEECVKTIQAIDYVTGVYPVYAASEE